MFWIIYIFSARFIEWRWQGWESNTIQESKSGRPESKLRVSWRSEAILSTQPVEADFDWLTNGNVLLALYVKTVSRCVCVCVLPLRISSLICDSISSICNKVFCQYLSALRLFVQYTTNATHKEALSHIGFAPNSILFQVDVTLSDFCMNKET